MQEMEPDCSNLDVDYDFFDNFIWQSLAERYPAMEELKVNLLKMFFLVSSKYCRFLPFRIRLEKLKFMIFNQRNLINKTMFDERPA